MSILTDTRPVAVEPGTYNDEDFLALAQEVTNLADMVGELIKVAQYQSDLIGILLYEAGLEK